MSTGNPTLDAAESSTGIEPLNSHPKEPIPLKQQQDTSTSTLPDALATQPLPPNTEPIILPLSLSSKLDTHQNTSSLPTASGFEELVKAEIRPPGPSRAEEVALEEWGKVGKAEYADLVLRVQEAAQGGEVGVYKLVVGKEKVEWFVVALELERERIVGVRVRGLEG